MTSELAYRAIGGIDVRLLWDPDSPDLTVTVQDTKSGEAFKLQVLAAYGLDAFYHPYVYAAHQGMPYGQAALAV